MGIVAKVVWDGGDKIEVPEELGKPREDQLQGTVREQLVELSGRVCYDSLGVGRNSAEYHKHIQEVGHLSVLEHAYATIQVSETFNPLVFINRPDIWVEANDVANGYRITFNPRSILEWASWTKVPIRVQPAAMYLGDLLHYHASKLYPQIVAPSARPALLENAYPALSRVIHPESDDEKWVSMFMGMSRGCSHELVRHGNFTAISQRSTRFVAENESPWIDHPLVRQYEDHLIREKGVGDWMEKIEKLKEHAKAIYAEVVERLQPWLAAKGIDKLTARKQARGSARGYLGNALYTEMVFSANVAQWKRMLRLRCSGPADAEIRVLFVEALKALQASRYARDFKDFSLIESPDKIGQIAVEK